MKETLIAKIMALQKCSTNELEQKYEELYEGKKAPLTNKIYLWRRIAYKMQEMHYGGLPETAQTRLQELVQEHDPINHRSTPKCQKTLPEVKSDSKVHPTHSRDRRLPIPGTVITKEYKGNKFEVKALDNGFEFQNKVYRSLTAIAKEITGAHWNGFLFFNI